MRLGATNAINLTGIRTFSDAAHVMPPA